MKVKERVGTGEVVGGKADVVRGCEMESDCENCDCEIVKESEGSGVPEKEGECVLPDLDSVISSVKDAVGSVTVRDSVGIKEAVREWVFQEGLSVGGKESEADTVSDDDLDVESDAVSDKE